MLNPQEFDDEILLPKTRTFKPQQILRLRANELGERIGLPYLHEILKAHVWNVESAAHLSEEQIQKEIDTLDSFLGRIEQNPGVEFKVKAYFLNKALWGK